MFLMPVKHVTIVTRQIDRLSEQPTFLSPRWQRWLWLTSPAGQLSSHPATGLLCCLGWASAAAAIAHGLQGLPDWTTFAGIWLIYTANALCGSAVEIYFEDDTTTNGKDPVVRTPTEKRVLPESVAMRVSAKSFFKDYEMGRR